MLRAGRAVGGGLQEPQVTLKRAENWSHRVTTSAASIAYKLPGIRVTQKKMGAAWRHKEKALWAVNKHKTSAGAWRAGSIPASGNTGACSWIRILINN